MAHFPAGLVVMGDAMCSFNPIYGQGMTVSALEAEALGATLAEQPGAWASIATRYCARAAKCIDIAWRMAVGEDFRYPATTGPKPRGLAFLNWYGSKVHAARLRDAQVTLAFVEVMNMRKPPASLFRPGMIWRVLRAGKAAPVQTPAESGYAMAGN
jgi:2-polyprenyl-6-methoxyphenol hydroxylase-like FAD-dependent oxidoreductase